jgi:hypothetical protein
VRKLRHHGIEASLLLGLLALSAALPGARAKDGVDGVTAVASKVSSDYRREKLPDGSFRPETYAFGEGRKWSGEINDPTFEKLRFTDVARIIAGPLASQKYLPARDPDRTKLLIMVYWGLTDVPPPITSSVAYDNLSAIQNKMADAAALARAKAAGAGSGHYHPADPNAGISDEQMDAFSSAMTVLNIENQQRAKTDYFNALMLGYDSPGLIGTEKGNYVRGTAFAADRDDLYSEIEENRYFVVLMAYDFQLLWKDKKHKLLWETRFSIGERRNAFDKALPVMARFAAQYFGQDSGGLLRTRVPEGTVEVKDPTLIEFLSEPQD